MASLSFIKKHDLSQVHTGCWPNSVVCYSCFEGQCAFDVLFSVSHFHTTECKQYIIYSNWEYIAFAVHKNTICFILTRNDTICQSHSNFHMSLPTKLKHEYTDTLKKWFIKFVVVVWLFTKLFQHHPQFVLISPAVSTTPFPLSIALWENA